MDEAKYLQLAENLSAFRKKLHARAKTWMFRNANKFCGCW